MVVRICLETKSLGLTQGYVPRISEISPASLEQQLIQSISDLKNFFFFKKGHLGFSDCSQLQVTRTLLDSLKKVTSLGKELLTTSSSIRGSTDIKARMSSLHNFHK